MFLVVPPKDGLALIVKFAPHFGNVPHPWALLIIKHKAKFIMNQTYVNHEVYEWEGSYACLIMGFYIYK